MLTRGPGLRARARPDSLVRHLRTKRHRAPREPVPIATGPETPLIVVVMLPVRTSLAEDTVVRAPLGLLVPQTKILQWLVYQLQPHPHLHHRLRKRCLPAIGKLFPN